MIVAPEAPLSAVHLCRPRRSVDVAVQQLTAIDQFHTSRRLAEQAAATVVKTRAERLDLSRRREVLRRQHSAMIAQSHQHLCLTSGALDLMAQARVVLAHRDEEFSGQVSALLQEQGVHVAARVTNGADAIGAAVAEQPDLVLVEDSLEMVSGEQVISQVREFCPDTVITAQVPYGDRVGELLEAGAAAVFTRRIPPVGVARQLLSMLARKVRRGT